MAFLKVQQSTFYWLPIHFLDITLLHEIFKSVKRFHKMMNDALYQTIEIFLSGRNLKDQDFFSKSDPYVKVSYRRDFNCKNYVPLGRT